MSRWPTALETAGRERTVRQGNRSIRKQHEPAMPGLHLLIARGTLDQGYGVGRATGSAVGLYDS